jgi:hypothetical protein
MDEEGKHWHGMLGQKRGRGSRSEKGTENEDEAE